MRGRHATDGGDQPPRPRGGHSSRLRGVLPWLGVLAPALPLVVVGYVLPSGISADLASGRAWTSPRFVSPQSGTPTAPAAPSATPSATPSRAGTPTGRSGGLASAINPVRDLISARCRTVLDLIERQVQVSRALVTNCDQEEQARIEAQRQQGRLAATRAGRPEPGTQLTTLCRRVLDDRSVSQLLGADTRSRCLEQRRFVTEVNRQAARSPGSNPNPSEQPQ